MLSTNIDLTNILAKFSIIMNLSPNRHLQLSDDFMDLFEVFYFNNYYFSCNSLFPARCTQIIPATKINAIGGRIIKPLLA